MKVESLRDICVRQTQEAHVTHFHCCIPPRFFGFKGHFEGMPILPGVCQLQLIIDGVTILHHQSPSIARIERMKFHNLIVPNTTFIVELEELPGAWRFKLFNEHNEFASGKLILR